MKVLFIGYVWPEPRSSAAGRRILDLIDLFQSLDGEVHFACAADPGEHPADLSQLGVFSHRIRLNCSSFDAQLEALQPDVVVFDRFVCEEQFGWRVEKVCPHAMRILDTEDLHCLRFARHQALKQSRPVSTVDLNNATALREIAAIWRSDLSLIISGYEKALLQDHFGVALDLLHYLPLMAGDKRPAGPDFEQRQHCVVVGNFRHAPNWDAVQYLRNTLWPDIRRRLGRVECHVYGAYQPPKAQALHSDALGFLMKGWACDAAEVVSKARLCLAPLRFGAGQKGKLLEAMECATPSVTSSVGAEGMAEGQPWPGAVADAPEDFVAAVAALYQDRTRWLEASQGAARVLEKGFQKVDFQPGFKIKIKEIRSDLEAHRQKFFNGLMVRQQRLRSHQYMSQWIEAKSRLTPMD